MRTKPRSLTVVLDDSVTDFTCGTCHYRRISWDENTSSQDDSLILLMECTLIKGEKVFDADGNHTGWSNWLRGLDGLYLEHVYVETHESVMAGEPSLPEPETQRLRTCIERERGPDCLMSEEQEQLLASFDRPIPAPLWMQEIDFMRSRDAAE